MSRLANFSFNNIAAISRHFYRNFIKLDYLDTFLKNIFKNIPVNLESIFDSAQMSLEALYELNNIYLIIIYNNKIHFETSNISFKIV